MSSNNNGVSISGLIENTQNSGFDTKDNISELIDNSLDENARQIVITIDTAENIFIISDDGDAIVDKYSGFILRKLDFSDEEGFDESGFHITTNAVMEEDLGAIIKDNEKKISEKRVFESDTADAFLSRCA